MFRSAGITFGSKLLVAVVNFAIVILLSQWLGEAGKGRCSQYLLIFSAALIFSECISGATVGYLLTKYSHRQLLLLFYSWSALAAIVTGFLFRFLLSLSGPETCLVIVLNWINAVVTIHQLVAVGKQRLTLFNWLNVGQALLSIFSIAVVLLYVQQTPLAYLWAIGFAWGAVAAIGFVLVYFAADAQLFTSWKELAVAGFRTGMANQASTFLQLINTRIAYLLLPAASTGIYSNAVSLCEACLLINYSIGTIQYSRILNMKAISEKALRQQQIALTHECFWANAALMLVALSFLAVIPTSFYSWLFGPAFSAVTYPLHWLLPGIFVYSGYIIFTYFFSGTGRFIYNSYPAAAALLATLAGYGIIHLFQIPLSLTVAATVTVCSYSVLFITSLVLFLRFEKLSLSYWLQIPWKAIRKDIFKS